MKRTIKIGILLLVLLSFIGCDQLTKGFAKRELNSTTTLSFWGGAVRLKYVENPAFFMSLGSGLPDDIRILVHTATGIVIFLGLILLFSYIQHIHRTALAGLCLLLGGACGNLIDRLLNHGRVSDFITLELGQMRTGVFNIADVLILAGITVLLLSSQVGHSKTRPAQTNEQL